MYSECQKVYIKEEIDVSPPSMLLMLFALVTDIRQLNDYRAVCTIASTKMDISKRK